MTERKSLESLSFKLDLSQEEKSARRKRLSSKVLLARNGSTLAELALIESLRFLPKEAGQQ